MPMPTYVYGVSYVGISLPINLRRTASRPQRGALSNDANCMISTVLAT
jgi:hypothetical protein